MGHQVTRKLKQAGKRVQHTQEELNAMEQKRAEGRQATRNTLPPKPHVLEVTENAEPERRTKEYVTVELTGSTGKRYKVAVPKTYARHIPKTWKWDETKFKVAEAIAMGVPILHITEDPEYGVSTRMTIYAWLEHPEFREHVDGLTMETGWANYRERVAGLNRVTRKLFDKVVNELDAIKLTDKSLGAVLTAIPAIAKLIAQEKGEFIEASKVEQQTTLNATVAMGVGSIEDMLNTLNGDERKKLEKEFDALGDQIIQQFK